jgi:hypothetical protein
MRRTALAIPNPLFSDRQFDRFHNQDVEYLETREIAEELWSIRPYLYRLPDDHWLREREKALGAEMARRTGRWGRR